MLKRFEATMWTMGAMVPMILAGCSATSPTSTPATQPEKAAYTTQGGGGEAYAQPHAATNPCDECPAIAPYGAGLQNLAQLTANPVLDYSWYYNRGNFGTFGWAPGFYANLQNFMYYPTASGYWPYSYDHGRAGYVPYSTVYGGRTLYPYLGLGGGMVGSYAGMGRQFDRRDDHDDGRDGRDGGDGRNGDMGQNGQAQSQGQTMAQGQRGGY